MERPLINDLKKHRRALPLVRDMRIGVIHMVITASLLLLLAVSLSVLPRTLFQSGLLLDATNLIIAYWPKLNADRMSLLKLNPTYAEKFVFSYFLLTATATLMCVISSFHLLVLAFRWQFQVDRNFDLRRCVAACLFAVPLLIWWTIFFPTPFRDAYGFSTRFPSWEFGFFYAALFLFCLWGALVASVKAVCFLFFGFKRSDVG